MFIGFELPRINYKQCNGKPYRYVYGSGVFEKGYYANSVWNLCDLFVVDRNRVKNHVVITNDNVTQICKLDVKNKSALLWKESDTAFPGEALFIPRPGGSEDEGQLLSVVIETDQSKPHFLVMIDSKTMKETARAEFSQAHVEIPPTIHGLFLNH